LGKYVLEAVLQELQQILAEYLFFTVIYQTSGSASVEILKFQTNLRAERRLSQAKSSLILADLQFLLEWPHPAASYHYAFSYPKIQLLISQIAKQEIFPQIFLT
jgi:hypothetical protein